MTGIIDYGVGNLFSLCSSCACIGEKAFVSGDPAELAKADRLVLPGVGAFADAANKLRDTGMAAFVRAQAAEGKPLLGICLGMQLLFDRSYEYGEHAGLGLIPGTVKPIAEVIPAGYKIPHMGWNPLRLCQKDHPLWKYIREGDAVYFVHSYYATECAQSVIDTAEYGAELTVRSPAAAYAAVSSTRKRVAPWD